MTEPINWTNAGGTRNRKINCIVTELVRQATIKDFSKYGRSSVEKAIRVIAEVGDPQVIDSYVEDICSTEAVKARAGEYYITDVGRRRFQEERADG